MMELQMARQSVVVSGETFHCDAEACCHGIYVLHGTVTHDGTSYASCDGFFASGHILLAGDGVVLLFNLSSSGLVSSKNENVLTANFEHDEEEALVRFDQVIFPPTARAYRHIHPGPGIRHLISGRLEIKSDHDVTWMEYGSAWFEDANSPVQATAADVPETSFIRMLVLPVAYEGKPTIKLLDPADEALPKLQSNRRFFDQRIQLPSFKRSSSER